MKTKKSKIVAILLLATLILTTNLSSYYVYADTSSSTCIHDYYYFRGGVYYYSNGHSEHLVSKDIDYRCSKCGGILNEYSQYYEPHSLNEKDWHSGTKHYYHNECRYCEYSHDTSWACSGPPCVTPNRLNLLKD